MTTNLDTRLASYQSPVLSIFRIVFGLMFTLHGTI
jgi:putative oxidoreductase